MKLNLLRYSDNGESTTGLLFIDDVFECYTLEDEHREVKVKGETRIPNGTYKIKLRTVGGFDARYKERYKSMHKGMLELQDVPNFKYILIHSGNTDDHTSGCILIGSVANNNQLAGGFISRSRQQYKVTYPKIAEALEKGEEVEITISSL